MIKFVDTNAETYELKRKHTPARACGECRRKKKRCYHEAARESEPQFVQRQDSNLAFQSASHTAPSRTTPTATGSAATGQHDENAHRSPVATVASKGGTANDFSAEQSEARAMPKARNLISTSQEARTIDARFVGNMNPEGVFLAAVSPGHLRSSPAGGGVGYWLAQQANHAPEDRGRSALTPSSSVFAGCSVAIQQIVLPVMERECLSTIPPRDHLQKLRKLYFQRFHDLFPAIDRKVYEALPQDHAARVLSDQGICLLASGDADVRENLLLANEPEVLTCAVFGRRVFAAMRVAIEVGLVSDKVVLVQALALMTMYSYGREGSDNSSLTLSRAVQYALSLGLHVPESDDDANREHNETLFCCVWTLDRLHAALLGKPILLHERDIGRPLLPSFQAQKPAFQLLLHVVELIDRVVPMYRPRSDTVEIAGGFPMFEDLIITCNATGVRTDHLVTIEILYHAMAVLSCPSRSDGLADAPSAAERTRQALSSERITTLVGGENRDQLVMSSFVPYAVSLSLSLNYRDMRRSKVPLLRSRARLAFEANCNTLQRLGSIFVSAASMAEIGRRTLKEVDRVYLQVLDDSRRKSTAIPYAADATNASNFATTNDGEQPYNFEPEPAMMEDSNPFYFTEMPLLDPFEMFDPAFDLNDVDACLESNLDLAAPVYWSA